MCGGMGFVAPQRVVLTERTDDNRLSGRLRAIADRAQGNLYDAMTARDIAAACKAAGTLASMRFWRGYADEAERNDPEPYPIRHCPVCRAAIVPAAVGVLRVNCPACDPFTVREAVPVTRRRAEA